MLKNRTVLLVEDEYFIADDLATALRSAGAKLMGPVATLEAALDEMEVRGMPDMAILDINLRGENVFPLADRLLERSVPVLFVTGYAVSALPERYRNLPHVHKPSGEEAIIQRLMEMSKGMEEA